MFLKNTSLLFFFITSLLPSFAYSDDYLYSLSWSPTYCLTNPNSQNSSQCKNFSNYRFIIHGLWNTNREKIYCKTSRKDLPAQIKSDMFKIMPSISLIEHEWQKHGRCSQDNAHEYFTKISRLFHDWNINNILQNESTTTANISQIKQEFTGNINGLKDENITILCSGRMLKEVRICLNDKLGFRKCSTDETRNSCKIGKIYIPIL